MTQLQRMLLAFGTVAMIGGTYVAQTPSEDRSFHIGLWICGIASLVVALWLIWRDRSVTRRMEWLLLGAGEMLFTMYLIVDAVFYHRLTP